MEKQGANKEKMMNVSESTTSNMLKVVDLTEESPQPILPTSNQNNPRKSRNKVGSPVFVMSDVYDPAGLQIKKELHDEVQEMDNSCKMRNIGVFTGAIPKSKYRPVVDLTSEAVIPISSSSCRPIPYNRLTYTKSVNRPVKTVCDPIAHKMKKELIDDEYEKQKCQQPPKPLVKAKSAIGKNSVEPNIQVIKDCHLGNRVKFVPVTAIESTRNPNLVTKRVIFPSVKEAANQKVDLPVQTVRLDVPKKMILVSSKEKANRQVDPSPQTGHDVDVPKAVTIPNIKEKVEPPAMPQEQTFRFLESVGRLYPPYKSPQMILDKQLEKYWKDADADATENIVNIVDSFDIADSVDFHRQQTNDTMSMLQKDNLSKKYTFRKGEMDEIPTGEQKNDSYESDTSEPSFGPERGDWDPFAVLYPLSDKPIGIANPLFCKLVDEYDNQDLIFKPGANRDVMFCPP